MSANIPVERVPLRDEVQVAIRIINHREILAMQAIALSDEACVVYHEALAIVRAYIAGGGNEATEQRGKLAGNPEPPNKENGDGEWAKI